MKASEVFYLPLDLDGCDVYQAGYFNGWLCEFDTTERAKVAANCINHADALADALAELLECAAENNLEGLQTYDDVYAALEAYRGAK